MALQFINRAVGLAPLLLCLGQLAMVDADFSTTPCSTETSTVLTSCRYSYISFYAKQTYNCTIGSGKSNIPLFSLFSQEKLTTTAL